LNAINIAIAAGFDVEIDIWHVNNRFFLGHDYPKCYVDESFLIDHSSRLWCHAKTLQALYALLDMPMMECFFHNIDQYTLTSNDLIWTYPDMPVTDKSIMLLFEKFSLEDAKIPEYIYGLCSDHIKYYRNAFNQLRDQT